MYNCYFEDADFYFKVKAKSFILRDSDGYFIKLQILSKLAVVELLKLNIVASYEEDTDIFFIKIYITNSSMVRINGMPLNALSNEYSTDSKLKRVSLKEAALKRYSEKNPKSTHMAGRACYAKRLLLDIR